jgi:hypothetical protein
MLTVTLGLDNQTFKVYLDGQLLGEITAVLDANTNARNLGMGWCIYSQSSTGGFGGKGDEFGIWDYALSHSEIRFLYNNGNGRPYSEF